MLKANYGSSRDSGLPPPTAAPAMPAEDERNFETLRMAVAHYLVALKKVRDCNPSDIESCEVIAEQLDERYVALCEAFVLASAK